MTGMDVFFVWSVNPFRGLSLGAFCLRREYAKPAETAPMTNIAMDTALNLVNDLLLILFPQLSITGSCLLSIGRLEEPQKTISES